MVGSIDSGHGDGKAPSWHAALRSTASTGITYETRKNRLNDPNRLLLRKYDPVAGVHVVFCKES